MKRPLIRLSISSTASNRQKQAYLAAIQAYRQKGMTVISDWPASGEREAHVVMPAGNRTQQIAGYRISSALKNAFSGSYNL